MANGYYYLVSSLPELSLDDSAANNVNISIKDFLTLCEEEMSTQDFDSLKLLFLFNDIKNIFYGEDGVKEKNDGETKHEFIFPSYYNKEDFRENMKDTDSLLPFLATYFFFKKKDKRVYPDLMAIDEIYLLFYEYIHTIKSDFVRAYFLFELNLQNVTTALSLRSVGLPFENKILPHGHVSMQIIKNPNNDFGIAKELYYLNEVMALYEKGDLVEMEKGIAKIRWNWLDERVEGQQFSNEVIFAYAVKLLGVNRWKKLSYENGKVVLDKLIQEIENNVKFPEEFLTVGGPK